MSLSLTKARCIQSSLYIQAVRVVYTVILSSLIALLLPSIFGALHLIKEICYNERG